MKRKFVDDEFSRLCSNLDLIDSTSQLWQQKCNDICRFEWISIFYKFDIAETQFVKSIDSVKISVLNSPVC